MTDRLTLNRAQLAALLAHHADVLAARWRAVAPGAGAWEVAAAFSLTAHANELTADRETPAVAELLDSIITCPIEQPAAVEPSDQPRLFHLQRDHDVSGVSGTGRVANGVLWPDGTVSLRWIGDRPSTVHWDRLEDAVHVHGHGGATRIVWADEQPPSNRAAGLREAIAKVRAIPVQCTGLTGPVWFGQGWNDAIGEFEEIADRMADEAQPATETQPESCAHCGKDILRISGTLTEWWVHDPGGHTICFPQQAASSPRATPKPAAGARQDGAQTEAANPRTVCVCGHTRAEHVTVSGRLLCDVCEPDSTENLVCKEFEAL
ncbi:hypothetical protein [Streptomyces sp. HC307]|uniref:hypothetical protein n=1 Tax=Streptomyces flavusporus TaxID=3385496 RepID=UPI0039171851